MKIHPLRIDFQVTPEIQRFVYLYIIEGRNLYLVDAGVAGSESIIWDYLISIDRRPEEIKALFITHSHPDHIGSAAKIKQLSGCTVYASAGERGWIENIDCQFAERPIPNFYNLLNESVSVDVILKDGDTVFLEEGMHMDVMETSGHSAESLSFYLREAKTLFTGDAIPLAGDIPIYISAKKSIKTLKAINAKDDILQFYSAWDSPRNSKEGKELIATAIMDMEKLDTVVKQSLHQFPDEIDIDILIREVARLLGQEHLVQMPLFKRSIIFHLNEIKST